jgi:hypothetical protein
MTENCAVVLGLLADPPVPSQVHAEFPVTLPDLFRDRLARRRWRRMNKAQCASWWTPSGRRSTAKACTWRSA